MSPVERLKQGLAKLRTIARAAAVPLGRALVSRMGQSALTVAAATAALAPPELADYLNRTLFLVPVASFRYEAGLGPDLRDDVRLIVTDDRSLQKLGRFPTFAEWEAIGRLLAAEGFETALLHGFHGLKQEVGELAATPAPLRLYAAAVPMNDPRNSLALPAEKVATELLLPYRGPLRGEHTARPEALLAPAPAVLERLAGLGDLSIDDHGRMAVAIPLDDGRLLPNLALRASRTLEWTGDGFRTDAGVLPFSADGDLYPDWVPREAISHRSLPVSAFFDAKYERIDDISPKMREILRGGRIAVLIPAGHTGQRFVDGPGGKWPSYMLTVSLVSNLLDGRLLHAPWPHWLLVLVAAGLVLLALWPRSFRLNVALGTGMILLAVGGGFAALQLLGWVLPVAPAALIATAGLVGRVCHHLLSTLKARLLLEKDLELGKVVQTYVMPRSFAGVVGRWEYLVVYKPYGHMAGDWAQLYQPRDGDPRELAVLAIGDVVGKGPSAALNTAVIANAWGTVAEAWDAAAPDPDALVSTLHKAILRTFRGEQNSTLSLAVLEPERVRLLCVAAPKWLTIAPDGTIVALKARPSMPLGWTDEGERGAPHWQDLTPADGTIYLAFTDGVMEGNRAVRRFGHLVEDAVKAGSALTFDALARFAQEAGKGEVLADDVTLLMIRRRTEAEAKQAA